MKIVVTLLAIFVLWTHFVPEIDAWYFWHYKSGAARWCDEEETIARPASTLDWRSLTFNHVVYCD